MPATPKTGFNHLSDKPMESVNAHPVPILPGKIDIVTLDENLNRQVELGIH